jgi:DNA-directed RNA polymerase specialized sigma24 family protein
MSHVIMISTALNQIRVVSSQPSSGSVSRHTIDDACLEAYQRELDYLMRTLRRLGVPPEDAEDLAHEVFLVLRRTWQRYDATRALKPFLFGIAFRVAASHRRKHWRELPFPTGPMRPTRRARWSWKPSTGFRSNAALS